MNIYLSSSWKQRDRVRALAIRLRKDGHEVYDFTDPACRDTPEIPPERYPEQFDPAKHIYEEYLRSAPWDLGVNCNRRALLRCDLVVLLLPCGNDANADWAFAVGAGKRSVVCGSPVKGERTPTHLWADQFVRDEDELFVWLYALGSATTVCGPGSAQQKIRDLLLAT